ATQTRLTDPHVSRVHCQVQVDGDNIVVSDFESASGTFVNGNRITLQILQDGDILRIGETELGLHSPQVAETATLLSGAATPTKRGAKAEPLTDLAGKTLVHFEVGPVLAKGRSAVVFRARDTKEVRDVALKVLAPEFSKNDEEMQRFIRAMKTMLPL